MNAKVVSVVDKVHTPRRYVSLGEGGLALESFGNAPSDLFKQFSSKVLVGLTEQQGEGDSRRGTSITT